MNRSMSQGGVKGLTKYIVHQLFNTKWFPGSQLKWSEMNSVMLIMLKVTIRLKYEVLC